MNFLKGVGTSRRPPLAHLWHTSGTPLAHPWSTPGGSPRLPPEKNKKFLTEEQGQEEGGEEKGKKKAAHWSFGIGRLINECAAQGRAGRCGDARRRCVYPYICDTQAIGSSTQGRSGLTRLARVAIALPAQVNRIPTLVPAFLGAHYSFVRRSAHVGLYVDAIC